METVFRQTNRSSSWDASSKYWHSQVIFLTVRSYYNKTTESILTAKTTDHNKHAIRNSFLKQKQIWLSPLFFSFLVKLVKDLFATGLPKKCVHILLSPQKQTFHSWSARDLICSLEGVWKFASMLERRSVSQQNAKQDTSYTVSIAAFGLQCLDSLIITHLQEHVTQQKEKSFSEE